jgi:outer membrane receptor protein involved in Fe transport
LDGIEISDRNFAAIDPNSIERIEVIRGPEASAIYGSDAIGGVMQVFTKHGAGGARPVVDLQAAVGTIESPYAGYSGASRQEYSASLQGGTPVASYNIGAGYTRSGNWVPQGAAQLPSAFGGAHMAQGPVTIDLSARYYAQDEYAVVTPDEMQVGIPSISKPLNRAAQTGEETYGGHLTYQATPWWQHTLTLGADRVNQDVYTTSPVLTTTTNWPSGSAASNNQTSLVSLLDDPIITYRSLRDRPTPTPNFSSGSS